jgi:WD40 repeat protein
MYRALGERHTMNNQKTKKTVIVIALIVLGCVLTITQSNKVWLLWIPPLEIEKLPPQISSPIPFTTKLQEISTEKVDRLNEIANFRLSKNEAPIIAISEDIDQQILMGINEKGDFVHWEIESQTGVKQFDFRAAYPDSTNFSEDGSRVLATEGHVLWDSFDGTAIHGSPDVKLEDDEDERLTVLLDPTGSLIIFPSSRLMTRDLIKKGLTVYYSNDCLFTDLEPARMPMRRVAIDRSSTYLAYILPNGVVCVRELKDHLSYSIKYNLLSKEKSPIGQLRFNLPGKEVETKFAAFDPTRNWLAVITENELVVWDLQDFFSPVQLNQPTKDGATLAFDRSGKILVLGTTRGIQVFDVEKSKLISEIELNSVTALFFSRDNRLLIAGDSQGVVHIFGIPK